MKTKFLKKTYRGGPSNNELITEEFRTVEANNWLVDMEAQELEHICREYSISASTLNCNFLSTCISSIPGTTNSSKYLLMIRKFSKFRAK